MYLLLKVYDVPQSVISGRSKAAPHLSLSEDDVRRQGLNSVPDDLTMIQRHRASPISLKSRGPHPLSPAVTGHYHYARLWSGMNTDASGSGRREEVMPQPQRAAGEKIFTTDWPIPSREVTSN